MDVVITLKAFGHFYDFKTFNKQWNVVHEANYDFGNSKQ